MEISVVSEPLSAPLLEDHPLVDNLIIIDPSLSSRARAIARLRRSDFDIAFNMHGGTTASLIARLSGARRTFGYRGHRHTWTLTDRAPAPDAILLRDSIHSVEQQLALLHWSGLPWPTERPQLSLAVSEEAQARARKLAAESCISESFAIIAPSAATEAKRWRASGFAAVVEHLSERWNLSSIVIAGPGQEHVAREVSATARERPPVISGLSLKELMALTQRSAIFVGNDSGPAHIAAAFSRPMVVLFGSSNPQVWHPWTDSPYRIAQAENKDAIALIPESEVIASVDEVLEASAQLAQG
jgi:ADP-heptose:LPS heptosyltransferase